MTTLNSSRTGSHAPSLTRAGAADPRRATDGGRVDDPDGVARPNKKDEHVDD
jgi:hypothetical protein